MIPGGLSYIQKLEERVSPGKKAGGWANWAELPAVPRWVTLSGFWHHTGAHTAVNSANTVQACGIKFTQDSKSFSLSPSLCVMTKWTRFCKREMVWCNDTGGAVDIFGGGNSTSGASRMLTPGDRNMRRGPKHTEAPTHIRFQTLKSPGNDKRDISPSWSLNFQRWRKKQLERCQHLQQIFFFNTN